MLGKRYLGGLNKGEETVVEPHVACITQKRPNQPDDHTHCGKQGMSYMHEHDVNSLI